MAVAFRLLPSMKAVQQCVDYRNSRTNSALSYTQILPFKKTQVGVFLCLHTSQRQSTNSRTTPSTQISSSFIWRASRSSKSVRNTALSFYSIPSWARRRVEKRCRRRLPTFAGWSAAPHFTS